MKKETKSLNLLLNRTFQNRYCILDLTKFIFKYAKAPNEAYTIIHLKDIIDIYLEKDPKVQGNGRSKSFFAGNSLKQEE